MSNSDTSELAGANNSENDDSHQSAPKQPDLTFPFVNHRYEANKEESGLQLRVAALKCTGQFSLLLHKENVDPW